MSVGTHQVDEEKSSQQNHCLRYHSSHVVGFLSERSTEVKAPTQLAER
jgi:hypothetical protein